MDHKNKLTRIVLLSAAAGFLAAFLLAGVSYYLGTHGLDDTSGARFSASIGRFLWPTAILMMDANEDSDDLLLLLLISATLNALIYGFFAYCIYTVWSVLAGPKDDGWWPPNHER